MCEIRGVSAALDGCDEAVGWAFCRLSRFVRTLCLGADIRILMGWTLIFTCIPWLTEGNYRARTRQSETRDRKEKSKELSRTILVTRTLPKNISYTGVAFAGSPSSAQLRVLACRLNTPRFACNFASPQSRSLDSLSTNYPGL